MPERKNNAVEAPTDRSLHLTRIFDAPRELVYEAWTKKEHLDKWSCPNGFTIPESSVDFREGGQWRNLMIAPDGGRHAEAGVYQKIVPNELIVMSQAWLDEDGKPKHETKITVRFEDAGPGKTKLTLLQSVFESGESRDDHNEGWTECFDKLGEILAKQQGKNPAAAKPALPDDLKLVLTRVFDAPRKLVYEAWTQKEHMDNWACPKGFTIPESTADFREGGKWYCLMIAPNGDRYPVGGVYQKIVPDELLVMTHAWEGDDGKPEHETTLTVRLEDAAPGKTKLTMEQAVFRSIDSRDGHVGGWTQGLDKLGELLAKLQK